MPFYDLLIIMAGDEDPMDLTVYAATEEAALAKAKACIIGTVEVKSLGSWGPDAEDEAE